MLGMFSSFLEFCTPRYVRALGAYYLRLTGTAMDCYNYLEPLYNDYRKVAHANTYFNLAIIVSCFLKFR